MTQTDLAKVLGYYDKSVISHIENGDADMTYEKILLLIKTFKLDANELFSKIYSGNAKNDKVLIYIHGQNGKADKVLDYCPLGSYDVKGLDYFDGNPWDVGPIIKNKFEKLTKNYKEVIVVANSIGAFYAYEYLSGYDKIKRAFFISPIVNMSQVVLDLIMNNDINMEDLKENKFITLDDNTVLSYDFFMHVSEDYQDSWTVKTDVLYGSNDDFVYIEHIADFVISHEANLTIKNGSEHYFNTEEEKKYIRDWISKSLDL